jgi:hypothetical protein
VKNSFIQKIAILVTLSSVILNCSTTFALYTEVSFSHSYKKTTFSTDNFIESELLSGSISFYIWDHVALETSYTKGYALRKEKDFSNILRTITQDSRIYGLDLVLSLSERKATFQPYFKGGTAYITKKQTVTDDGQQAFEINPQPGLAPSYGFGLKIKFTDALALTTGFDIWQTPVDDGGKTNDSATRSGITWIF